MATLLNYHHSTVHLLPETDDASLRYLRPRQVDVVEELNLTKVTFYVLCSGPFSLGGFLQSKPIRINIVKCFNFFYENMYLPTSK